MDAAAQWPQGIVGVASKGVVEEGAGRGGGEKKARPQKEQALNCPRCNSTNTKFCYYNNYSLSQPRYFCKTCRRYWTEGGSLRNVPVGGGSRKNKRSASSSSSSSKKPSISIPPDLITSSHHLQNPTSKILFTNGSHDLNLAYTPQPSNNLDYSSTSNISNLVALQPNPNSCHHHFPPSMDFLKSNNNGEISSRGALLHTLMSADVSSIYSSSTAGGGLPPHPLHDLKTTLNFSLDGFDQQQNHSGFDGVEEASNNARMFFPAAANLEDLKQNEFDHQQQLQSGGAGGQLGDHPRSNHNNHMGYWNAMLGGGSW